MNISSPDALRPCTSCQMCAAVCPTGAISIQTDPDGFYRPAIDPEKCIHCSLCRRVCYKFDPEITPTSVSDLSRTTLFAAWAKDDAVVADTSSGGIADLLARQLITDGYSCIGVAYDVQHSFAYHLVATNKDQTTRFRGSKYIQSYTVNAFREVVQHCNEEKFAIFGTPCQIYAIERFLKSRGLREKCLLIDLYCHGCPSMLVWQKYMQEIRNRIPSCEIDAIKFRSKIKGWGKYVIEIVAGSTVYTSSLHNDEFYDLFFSDLILNGACHDCRLRSTLAYTDIRLGDFWGKRYGTNSRGVSAVSLVTSAGRVAFDKILPAIDCVEESYINFIPYQSWNKIYHPSEKLRSCMFQQIRDPKRSLCATVHTFHKSQTFRQRFKRYIKNAIYYLPDSFSRKIKRFYY